MFAQFTKVVTKTSLQEKYFLILIVIFILVSIPITVYSSLQVRDFRSKAAQSPPVFDAASSAGWTDTNTLTWTHTVGAGTNRFLLVGVSIRETDITVTNVTYKASNLTFVGAKVASVNRIEIWRLVNPPAGTGTITVTTSGRARVAAGATSW